MTHEEFQKWLLDEVQHNRMTTSQMNDLLAQKEDYDLNRTEIEREFRWRVVGYVNRQRRTANTVHNLLDESIEEFPGRMIYFEPVGFDLL
ncbi:MAG TPA: hypothetical protein VKC61_20950 [Pyrinomonadaceae bacterium]|nr:hypothetical protein [Pyrinomonadaceae bacterium]